MIVLGIDPGLSGALASWDGITLTLLEMPAVKSTGRGRIVVWSALSLAWDEHFPDVTHAFLERVQAQPKDGGSSAFKFGTVFGGLQGMIAAKGVPSTLVTPRVWMKQMGVGGGDKTASVIRASELFPEDAAQFRGPRGGLKDGVAEASLIALYGFQKLEG